VNVKEILKELYEDLKGTRVKNGSLIVPNFNAQDYEQLYFMLLDELRPIIKNDFYGWYGKAVKSYAKYRKRYDATNDVYIPQIMHPLEEHTTQMQLAVFKHYIYRRATSKY
jgi:hypothetical protein